MKERKKKNVKGLLIYDDVKRKKRKKKESGLTYVRSKQQTKTYIYKCGPTNHHQYQIDETHNAQGGLFRRSQKKKRKRKYLWDTRD